MADEGTLRLVVQYSQRGQWIAEATAIAQEHAMSFMADAFLPGWDGAPQVAQGEYEEGYAKLTHFWRFWRDGGGLHMVPYGNLMRATALMELGRFD